MTLAGDVGHFDYHAVVKEIRKIRMDRFEEEHSNMSYKVRDDTPLSPREQLQQLENQQALERGSPLDVRTNVASKLKYLERRYSENVRLSESSSLIVKPKPPMRRFDDEGNEIKIKVKKPKPPIRSARAQRDNIPGT